VPSRALDYCNLSPADVRVALDEIAGDAQTTFGRLDSRQLNWRPDESRWSVAQCFEHLLTANRLMLQSAAEALDETRPRTIWQRMPVLPRLLGTMLVRSQAPQSTRKFVAPAKARPSASSVSPDVIQQFANQQRDLARQVSTLDEHAARTIMTSPFVRVVTYSVLDGWRLLVAHDHRHLEQARRVMQLSGFPAA
jgi:hypothetical protein